MNHITKKDIDRATEGTREVRELCEKQKEISNQEAKELRATLEKLTNELTINGMLVKTTHQNPSRDNQTFYVSSQTDAAKTYIVRTREFHTKIVDRFGQTVPDFLIPTYMKFPTYPPSPEFEYICSCPDFIVRKWADRKDCEHVEAVKVLGGPYRLAQWLLSL